MALVTLASVKAQLRIASSPDSEDEDIRSRIAIAEELVLTYIKSVPGSPAEWADESETPEIIKGAIRYQAVEIYRYRGDEDGPQRNPYRMLSPFVEGILSSYRDPTLA